MAKRKPKTEYVRPDFYPAPVSQTSWRKLSSVIRKEARDNAESRRIRTVRAGDSHRYIYADYAGAGARCYSPIPADDSYLAYAAFYRRQGRLDMARSFLRALRIATGRAVPEFLHKKQDR